MTLKTPPGATLDALRNAPPLVHCITNYVAMNFAANVLLATGASPAMIHTPEESGDFAEIASALTVNIGTLSPHWVTGMVRAIASARENDKPWVLDPVGHFASPYRNAIARDLLSRSPTILRGNASEILALAGEASEGKGVDAGDTVEDAETGAFRLASYRGIVVAVTGEVDYVTDGTRTARVHGGSSLMPQVTATGCALTTLCGATAAANPDPFEAAVAALAIFAAAGADAHTQAEGPGSFAWRFLDALSALTASRLADVQIDLA